MSQDRIYLGFLARQAEELAALSAASPAFACRGLEEDGMPASVFIAILVCRHAVREAEGVRIVEGPCEFALQFPAEYLRRVYHNSGQILSLINPVNCYHPNVRWPHICTGPITPGTSAVELVLRVNEILTFNRFTPREDDCLNAAACQWARCNMDAFPLERRPLKRSTSSPDLPGIDRLTIDEEPQP